MADRVTLRIRDSYDLKVSREALMELPESVLLCLFPNGVVLNAPHRGSVDGEGLSEGEDEDIYFVDFDGPCLEYVLHFFDKARTDFYGTSRPPGDDQNTPGQSMQNPLFHKQAIIVLREELEYFSIPPKRGPNQALDDPSYACTSDDGAPNQALLDLKRTCGDHLLSRRSIFTALQRNVNRENNVAEQHLIDMLCMSGFNREDEWGYRAVEPNRCCITSIALVLLKTGISHPPRSIGNPTGNDLIDAPRPGVTVNASQLATAQKLLLFWRKPARKCWWDAAEMEITGSKPIKVWARRVWTLELSVI